MSDNSDIPISDAKAMEKLVSRLSRSTETLAFAQHIATAIVNGPANHGAATLSVLAMSVGIYARGANDARGLEMGVVALAWDLERRRGWSRVRVGQPLRRGDIGVVIANEESNHMYLVVDPLDSADPLIADNQETALHHRRVRGDLEGCLPTTYFLRAPSLPVRVLAV